MPKAVWVTRDQNGYHIWAEKPKFELRWLGHPKEWNGYGCLNGGLCPKEFHRHTTIRLKSGETGIKKGRFNFIV